ALHDLAGALDGAGHLDVALRHHFDARVLLQDGLQHPGPLAHAVVRPVGEDHDATLVADLIEQVSGHLGRHDIVVGGDVDGHPGNPAGVAAQHGNAGLV